MARIIHSQENISHQVFGFIIHLSIHHDDVQARRVPVYLPHGHHCLLLRNDGRPPRPPGRQCGCKVNSKLMIRWSALWGLYHCYFIPSHDQDGRFWAPCPSWHRRPRSARVPNKVSFCSTLDISISLFPPKTSHKISTPSIIDRRPILLNNSKLILSVLSS